MTGNRLAVSVIVPCYNAAAYLAAALDSILAQDHPPSEVIVVDDGSTDSSLAVATRYGSAICRKSQDHRGIGASRNRGIALAQGNTIAFLDADDLWPKWSLGRRMERLAADPGLAGVYGRVEAFISPEIPAEARALIHCPAGATAARLAGAMLIRRCVFDRIGAFDSTCVVGETMDWVTRLEEANVAMAPIDDIVLQRRIHETNTVTREKARQSDYLHVLKAALDRRRRAGAGVA
jgi:glycosyltransferase involved in cell wall biosynthesis